MPLTRENIFDVSHFFTVIISLVTQGYLSAATSLYADEMMQVFLQLAWIWWENRHCNNPCFEASQHADAEIKPGKEHQQHSVPFGQPLILQQVACESRSKIVQLL